MRLRSNDIVNVRAYHAGRQIARKPLGALRSIAFVLPEDRIAITRRAAHLEIEGVADNVRIRIEMETRGEAMLDGVIYDGGSIVTVVVSIRGPRVPVQVQLRKLRGQPLDAADHAASSKVMA